MIPKSAGTSKQGTVEASTGFWRLHRGSTQVGSFHSACPVISDFSGDWDCDGEDTVAVYRPSNGMFYVRNSNTQGNADATFPVGIYSGVIALHP